MRSNTVIYGLVLCGGKSTRMGRDKGAIVYHDAPQQEHLYALLSQVCERTFLSIREEQKAAVGDRHDYILDKNEFRGPFNGLLSAHKEYPKVAWLVIACDLPLMNLEALEKLIRERDTAKIATAFATNSSGLPEPLAAIWEPRSLEQAIQYLANGNGSCPRKFLINSEVKCVFPEDDEVLLNSNSEQDYQKVLEKLSSV